MNIPSHLKYTRQHEWIKAQGDEAIVGITDFAQSELGDIVFIDIDSIGKKFKQGETFGTIEAVKTVSDLFMPVDGETMEKNSLLLKQPELVNKDPYGDGWLIKIKISNPNQLNALLDADTYATITGK